MSVVHKKMEPHVWGIMSTMMRKDFTSSRSVFQNLWVVTPLGGGQTTLLQELPKAILETQYLHYDS